MDVEVIGGGVGEEGKWSCVEIVGVGYYECFEIIGVSGDQFFRCVGVRQFDYDMISVCDILWFNVDVKVGRCFWFQWDRDFDFVGYKV